MYDTGTVRRKGDIDQGAGRGVFAHVSLVCALEFPAQAAQMLTIDDRPFAVWGRASFGLPGCLMLMSPADRLVRRGGCLD